jgi:predicted alpha/beta superfamily hydrolase
MPPAPGLTIELPPKESGPERLYRVVYVIDVNAMNPRQAAERTYEIMQDPQSIRPVLDIIDSVGGQTRVDLSDA